VVSGPDAEGKVQLQRGSFGIQSHVSRLAAPAGEARAHRTAGEAGGRMDRGDGADRGEQASGVVARWDLPDEVPPLEVDLRGMEVDEALRHLDNGLDRGVLAGLGELRIVHGVGRGILRAAVERHLRSHPQVASQRMGEVGEGGRGVTVAKLR
jgi:DNA mismatch repair protein MutS2